MTLSWHHNACSSILGTREYLPLKSENVLPVTDKEGKREGKNCRHGLSIKKAESYYCDMYTNMNKSVLHWTTILTSAFFTESMRRHWIAYSTRTATAPIKSWCKRRHLECPSHRHTRQMTRRATGRGRQQRQHITLRRQIRMNGQDWQDWDLIKTIKTIQIFDSTHLETGRPECFGHLNDQN